MPSKGRPKDSGYRSQILIVHFLLAKGGKLCFSKLVEATGIHRNSVAPNAKVLIRKGLISKKRAGHKTIYKITDKKKAHEYILREFNRRAGVIIKDRAKTSSLRSTEDLKSSSSEWKALKEDVDYVVDKNLGGITFAHPPKGAIKVTYTAGYTKTPEAIEKATAILSGALVRWTVAMIKNDSSQIRRIPRQTWKQVQPLLKPYHREVQEETRQSILRNIHGYSNETGRLEEHDGLGIYKDYEALSRWLKELRDTDMERAKLKRRGDYGWKRLSREGRRKTKKKEKR